MYRRFKAAIYLAALLALCRPEVASGSEVLIRQSITSELRYDTNANLRGNDQNPSSDYVLILAPQVEAINERGRTRLSGLYRPTGYYYFRQPQINTINHYANGTMNTQLTQNTTFEANDILTYTKESLEASLIGVQTSRSGIWSNTVTLSTGHRLTANTEVSLSVSDNILAFDDPAASDSRTDSASAGINFAATENTSLNANYVFTYFTFKPPGSNERRLETQSLSAGFSHQFPYSLRVNASAGAVYAPSLTNHYDWVASAGITKAFRNSFFNIDYTRRTTNSSGLTDELNLNERYGARWTYSVTDTVDISASGDYVKNHTKPVAVVDMKSYDVGVSAVWRMRSWLSFGAGYSHFQQISNGPAGIDFKRDHLFINVTATTFERKF